MEVLELHFDDKFHLTPEQSRFLAKKKWDENVYCGMRMENRAVTFPQTQTILNGVNVPNVQLDDIQAILNMRDAWRYLLNTVEEQVTIEYLCRLNEFIARNEALEWGKLRTGTVGMSGTDYTPPIPEPEKVAKELAKITTDTSTTATEKALEAFVWGTRGQFFWDGNKRTSMMLANKILVAAGAGMLTITDKHMERFNVLLLNWYNTGKGEALKEFLYENAIQGMTI
ncbi:MAG: Fic family protein [Lachnospiraceae bacterium]|nr:Fic family protein [Lachnospiraceae bacterium]